MYRMLGPKSTTGLNSGLEEEEKKSFNGKDSTQLYYLIQMNTSTQTLQFVMICASNGPIIIESAYAVGLIQTPHIIFVDQALHRCNEKKIKTFLPKSRIGYNNFVYTRRNNIYHRSNGLLTSRVPTGGSTRYRTQH